MHLFWSLLKINFSRAVLSVRFVISILAVSLILFLTSYGAIPHLSDVVSVGLLSGSGNSFLIIGILPLFPFAISFATEWEEKAASFWIVRAGISNYVICKVIISAFSAVLVTLLGIWLYALFLLIKLPFFTSVSTGSAYASMLEAGQPLMYFLTASVHLSLSSALFAVAALWISGFIPNRFIAIAAPMVLYFVLLRMFRFWDIPPYLLLNTIVEGTYDAGSPLSSFMLKLGTVAILCILMGYGAVWQIRRRVQRD